MTVSQGISSAVSGVREPDGFVVLHIAEDGSYDLRIWGAERTHVLWVDDSAPGDRVYEQTSREGDAGALRELIGDSTIGHAGDGYLDDQTVQAIRAMAWRMDGERLKLAAEDTSDRQT